MRLQGAALLQSAEVEMQTPEELIAAHYRWWRVFAFENGVKLGPLSVVWYDGHLGWTWLCGFEHRIF